MAETDPVSNIVMSIMAAIIGIALICVGLIPLAVGWIEDLTNEAADWAPLLYLVIIVVILGLVMGVLRMFSTRSER